MHDTTRAVTAAVLTQALVRKRFKRGFVVANYVSPEWGWEADVWVLGSDGLATEFEVKVSASDFAHDRSKMRLVYRELEGPPCGWREVCLSNKHACLANADVRGPNRFYFVAPKGLILPELLPDFAGLIEMGVKDGKLVETITRAAPLLHATPVSDATRSHAAGVVYERFHRAAAEVI